MRRSPARPTSQLAAMCASGSARSAQPDVAELLPQLEQRADERTPPTPSSKLRRAGRPRSEATCARRWSASATGSASELPAHSAEFAQLTLGFRRRGAPPARGQHALLGAAARPSSTATCQRAASGSTDFYEVRARARRARRTCLPMAGHELTWRTVDPQIPPTSNGSASCSRLDSSCPPQRSCARERSSTAAIATRQRLLRSASRSARAGTCGDRARDRRLRAVRARRARLELLAKGLCGRRRKRRSRASSSVALPDYGDTLRPGLAVRELDPADGAPPWQLLVRVLEPAARPRQAAGRARPVSRPSAHGRMERLLRDRSVPAGLLFNGHTLQAHLGAARRELGLARVQGDRDMAQTAGRPICAALRLLLGQNSAARPAPDERLAALLRRQPQVPERGQREARRAGAPRAVRAAARIPGRP